MPTIEELQQQLDTERQYRERLDAAYRANLRLCLEDVERLKDQHATHDGTPARPGLCAHFGQCMHAKHGQHTESER